MGNYWSVITGHKTTVNNTTRDTQICCFDGSETVDSENWDTTSDTDIQTFDLRQIDFTPTVQKLANALDKICLFPPKDSFGQKKT